MFYLLMFGVGCKTSLFAAETYFPTYGDLVTEKYSWTQFPELQGIDVQCFAQDSIGNLWFGHSEGITVYDGLDYKSFGLDDGLPKSYIRHIKVTNSGDVYALYETGGLYTFQNNKWHHLKIFSPDSKVLYWNFCLTSQDTILVATNHGPVLIENKSMKLLLSDGSMIKQTGSLLKAGDSLTWNVFTIYQDNYENLWFVDISNPDPQFIIIPTWKENLQNKTTWKTYKTDPEKRYVGNEPYIYQDSKNRYWIYSFNELSGLYSFSNPNSAWTYYDLNQLGGDNLIISVCETSDGRLWFGGNGFLNVFDNGILQIYTPDDLEVQISPLHLLQSRDGALWLLSTNIEVHRIDYAYKNWKQLNDLHFQFFDEMGNEYFIEKNGKIIIHDTQRSTWKSFDASDGLMDMPNVVLMSNLGEIWAAGSHQGIAAVSRFNGKLWQTDLFPKLSWSTSFQAAINGPDSSLWFGSMGDAADNFKGGCIVYEKNVDEYTYQHYVFEPTSFNRVANLTQTSVGRIWAGGSQLLYFKSDKFFPEQSQKELEKSWIDHLIGSSDSSLWVAKGGVGVFRMKNNVWKKYTQKDGLADNMVSYLLELPNGNILAAAKTGISHFDGKSWSPVILPQELSIARESGTLISGKDNSIWINKASRAWYFRAQKSETHHSNLEFKTIQYKPDKQPPKTQITFFQEKLSVPANQIISWKAQDRWNATAVDEFTFSYKLDDEDWSNFSAIQSIQFLNMKPGDHSFQLKARDRDGNIDSTPAIVTFKVVPPVWQQPWFIILITLFSVTILGLLVALGINNKKLFVANQEISKVSAFKENFFLNISHELRTPLTMIIGALSLLSLKKDGNLNVTDQIGTVRQHSHYLLNLVNQLLEFRKIESGKYPLQVRELDIRDFITNIKKRFDAFALQHSILYELKLSIEGTGWFDTKHLEKILMNLVGNAFKYTPDNGHITISVKREFRDFYKARSKLTFLFPKHNSLKACEYLIITVKDTGVGIPADRLKNIFDRFYHVEHPGKLYYDSVGIGLDITKELVELHKGEIHVTSEEGKGAEFTVSIPIDKRCFVETEIVSADQELVVLKDDFANVDEIYNERRKLLATVDSEEIGSTNNSCYSDLPCILIVEDHPDLGYLLYTFLKDSFNVLLSADGKSGLEQARENLPDLIVSDVMMPEMDGIELTRLLKSDISTCHIPVILLTVKAGTENRIDGFETGADDYLAKPFDYQELKVRIENLLKSRKMLQERFSKEIHLKPKDITINSLDANFLDNCINVVENHISDPDFTIDLFCKKIGMSRTQAYKKVKSISGFPLKEFITHIKLKRAAQLLLESNLHISEIAHSLQFSDHAHLSRLFKKTFGVSPKEFRKNEKN